MIARWSWRVTAGFAMGLQWRLFNGNSSPSPPHRIFIGSEFTQMHRTHCVSGLFAHICREQLTFVRVAVRQFAEFNWIRLLSWIVIRSCYWVFNEFNEYPLNRMTRPGNYCYRAHRIRSWKLMTCSHWFHWWHGCHGCLKGFKLKGSGWNFSIHYRGTM